MERNQKTVIVTGASQGIGAGIVKAFLEHGYDVVGTARNATKSRELSASDHLALVDGDVGQFETAQRVAELAIKRFGSIDAVVASAGIFLVKPFTDTRQMTFALSFRRTLQALFTSHSLPSNRCRHRGQAAAWWASLHRWSIIQLPTNPLLFR